MRTVLSIIAALLYNCLSAQTHLKKEEIVFEKNEENIQLIKLSSSTESTSFAIQIRNSVKAHYHAEHTETIIVKSGSAEMLMNDSTFLINKGDFIEIPPKTTHSVKVTSSDPLVVISIQAPEFLGEDRIYIETKE